MRLPTVPSFTNTAWTKWATDLTKVLTAEFLKRTPDDTSRKSVYLNSPDGSIWEITVDDTGTLTTTKVLG